MQRKHPIAFAFPNKHCLLIPPTADPHDLTPYNQGCYQASSKPSAQLRTDAHAQAASHTWGTRAEAGPSVIFTNTRALASCFLPPGQRSDKQEWGGGFWDCPPDLCDALKQDAASSAVIWKGGTMKCSRGGPVLFLCSRQAELGGQLEGGTFHTATVESVAIVWPCFALQLFSVFNALGVCGRREMMQE